MVNEYYSKTMSGILNESINKEMCELKKIKSEYLLYAKYLQIAEWTCTGMTIIGASGLAAGYAAQKLRRFRAFNNPATILPIMFMSAVGLCGNIVLHQQAAHMCKKSTSAAVEYNILYNHAMHIHECASNKKRELWLKYSNNRDKVDRQHAMYIPDWIRRRTNVYDV